MNAARSCNAPAACTGRSKAASVSFMDPQRERIQADLRGLLAGEVFCDDPFTLMYASDASVYQMRPLGVVRPRGVGDVRAALKYAADQAIPIHARGAGTGLAGESLGTGLMLDFSRA